MASPCLDDNDVAELLSGTLPSQQLQRFEQHLASCSACRAEVGDLAELASQPRLSDALDGRATSLDSGALGYGGLGDGALGADELDGDTLLDGDATRLDGGALGRDGLGHGELGHGGQGRDTLLDGDATQLDSGAPSHGELGDGELGELGPGECIDHFEVRALLGRGGMGEVYLAEDTKLGRTVALKVVRAELLASEEARVRFEREAQMTARFSHPNIVTIHAVGEDAGRPYVALEHLVGETLQARLERGRLEPSELRPVALAVAEALAVAHEHGVLHRDLKPDNVHLGADGGVRVLDFGLAKAVGQQGGRGGRAHDEPLVAKATTTGGTPHYMAPEQWRAEPSQPATDVWALGVLMYRALSGQLPFDRPTALALRATVVEAVPSPRLTDAEPALSPWWDGLVARCLEKDPALRPEVETILAELREGPPVSRPARRGSRLLAAALLLVALPLLLALGVSRARSSQPESARRWLYLPPDWALLQEQLSEASASAPRGPRPSASAAPGSAPASSRAVRVARRPTPAASPSAAVSNGTAASTGTAARPAPTAKKEALFGTRE